MESKKKKYTSTRTLGFLYVAYVIAAIAIVARIAYIQLFYKPSDMEIKYFGTREMLDSIAPKRGSILDCKGKLIAATVPMYELSMDCSILKEEYRNDREKESAWRSKARILAGELAKEFGGTQASWYEKIRKKRDEGSHYLLISKLVDHETKNRVENMTLFREGRYVGGLNVNVVNIRKYPYGSLGRRAIGVAKLDDRSFRLTGIEDKCDDVLYGESGCKYLTRTDIRGVYVEKNSLKSKKVKDGLDVKMTLDMDIQDIADRALREVLNMDTDIEGGCCMVMDVETGAIRAMANLKKDRNGNLGETYNYAVARAENPGSVMKTATLMMALDEGKVELSDTIPAMDGRYFFRGAWLPTDRHASRAELPEQKISVEDGLKKSSNHVFRYIAGEYYGKKNSDMEHFYTKFKDYRLFEDFDFDINGLAACTIHNPAKSQDGLMLPMMATGYTLQTTPLHILTFYNAIANGGKMMKPYLIDSYMKDGKVVKQFRPEVIDASICKKSTADSLTKALTRVTSVQGGTAYWRLRNAKCTVAGKTGSAHIAYRRNGEGPLRQEHDGYRKIQASFAGFFPAEKPEYSIICVFYTRETRNGALEGSKCATAAKILVDEIWGMTPEWNEEGNGNREKFTKVRKAKISQDGNKSGMVPDVTGLGLSDAIFAIESNGYRCVWEGNGSVHSQSPARYTEYAKGGTVKLQLR